MWNLAHDDTLRLKLPEGVQTIAFTDDLAIAVIAKSEHEMKSRAEMPINTITGWLNSTGLVVAVAFSVCLPCSVCLL